MKPEYCRDGDVEGGGYLLGWGILLLNRTVDEGRNVASCGINLVLGLGNAQLSHQVIEDLDGLRIFLADLGIHGCDRYGLQKEGVREKRGRGILGERRECDFCGYRKNFLSAGLGPTGYRARLTNCHLSVHAIRRKIRERPHANWKKLQRTPRCHRRCHRLYTVLGGQRTGVC